MRPLLIVSSTLAILTAAAFLWLASALDAAAQQPYCAGACDHYGNPVADDPNLFEPRPVYDRHAGSTPRYEDDFLYEPEYVQPRRHYRVKHGHRHYKRRNHKRRYHKRRHYREYHAVPRTKFCRKHYEKRKCGRRWKKVKVKRCILVRNDLLHHYRDGGWRH